MSSAEGGEVANSLSRSSSMQRGMRLSSRSSCKEMIWLRRNSRSDSSSIESDLATSATLSQETTLMVMWSRISGVGRVSSTEGSGQASPTAGTGTVGGGTSRAAATMAGSGRMSFWGKRQTLSPNRQGATGGRQRCRLQPGRHDDDRRRRPLHRRNTHQPDPVVDGPNLAASEVGVTRGGDRQA
jgi:hypothetical protein